MYGAKRKTKYKFRVRNALLYRIIDVSRVRRQVHQIKLIQPPQPGFAVASKLSFFWCVYLDMWTHRTASSIVEDGLLCVRVCGKIAHVLNSIWDAFQCHHIHTHTHVGTIHLMRPGIFALRTQWRFGGVHLHDGHVRPHQMGTNAHSHTHVCCVYLPASYSSHFKRVSESEPNSAYHT